MHIKKKTWRSIEKRIIVRLVRNVFMPRSKSLFTYQVRERESVRAGVKPSGRKGTLLCIRSVTSFQVIDVCLTAVCTEQFALKESSCQATEQHSCELLYQPVNFY